MSIPAFDFSNLGNSSTNHNNSNNNNNNSISISNSNADVGNSSKRVRGDESNSYNNNNVPTIIAPNPNLAASLFSSSIPSSSSQSAFNNNNNNGYSDEAMDSILQSMESLGLNPMDKLKMKSNAKANAILIKNKEQELAQKEKEKAEQKAFKKELKDSDAFVLKCLLGYAHKSGKQDIQVKCDEIVYTIEWPEKKPAKVDDSYVKQYLKEQVFQNRLIIGHIDDNVKQYLRQQPIIDTHQHLDELVNKMFSEEERLRLAKETKAKPKLKKMKESESTLSKLISPEELMKIGADLNNY